MSAWGVSQCEGEHGEILDQIKQMPMQDWLQIQSGIGLLLATALSKSPRPFANLTKISPTDA